MVPLRDPIKNVVYSAESADLHSVMVDGRIVVQDRVVLGVDERDAARALQAAGERMWPRMGEGDWAGRDANQLSPQSFPSWDAP